MISTEIATVVMQLVRNYLVLRAVCTLCPAASERGARPWIQNDLRNAASRHLERLVLVRFQHERLPGGGCDDGQITRRMRFFLHRLIPNKRMLWLQLGKDVIVHVLWHARPLESDGPLK